MNKIIGKRKHTYKTTEHQEQTKFVQWCKLNKIPVASVPNGIWLKDGATRYKIMAKMKREGLAKGFPDLIVILQNRVLFIEMKIKGGTVSVEQKRWLKILKERGNEVAVCYSADEAIEVVESFVGGG